MDQNAIVDIRLLAELAEMKRTYSAIERFLPKSGQACILICSAEAGEGKTLTTAALSHVAAQKSGKKVLAIDFNWHTPALHSFFKARRNTTIGSLHDAGRITDFIQTTEVDNLTLLTAPKDVSDGEEIGLDTNLIGLDLIQAARASHDIIFIDSSPMFPTNRKMMDPVAFSRVVDGITLVVMANVTPRQNIKKARIILETAGAEILGAVVNHRQNPLH